MTRRAFLMAAFAVEQEEPKAPDTPYNRVSIAANQAMAQWKKWAGHWNSLKDYPHIDYQEALAWEPMMDMFRKVDSKRTDFIRGFR